MQADRLQCQLHGVSPRGGDGRMFVCMCVCMCVCICVCLCVYVWRKLGKEIQRPPLPSVRSPCSTSLRSYIVKQQAVGLRQLANDLQCVARIDQQLRQTQQLLQTAMQLMDAVYVLLPADSGIAPPPFVLAASAAAAAGVVPPSPSSPAPSPSSSLTSLPTV